MSSAFADCHFTVLRSVDGIEWLLFDQSDESNPKVAQYLRNKLRDGPSHCLIAFMEKHGGAAPPGWAGFRPLTSKISGTTFQQQQEQITLKLSSSEAN